MHNRCAKKHEFTLFVPLVLVIAVTAAALVALTATTENVFAYESNQAKSDVNECGNRIEPTNIACQNVDSQIQGDENVVALTAQQTFPERAILIVIKKVECVEGEECPNLPSPSDFTMQFQIGNNPHPVSSPGSSEGTRFTLDPGDYFVTEASPPDPPGIALGVRIFSPDCISIANGPIQAGEVRTCTLTNIYRPVSPP